MDDKAKMPYLAFNLNDGNEFIFDLLEERLSLGRNPRNEIVIDNNQISSFHAEFARQPNGAYLLTDLKSSNGTFVNSRRIESAELKPGDRVRFGQLEARFREMQLPGPGRGKKGPAPSAEEKRRDANSSEGPGSRTDLLPIDGTPAEKAAVEPTAKTRAAAAPNVQLLAPTCPPPGSCAAIPKPSPPPLQIVARVPLPPSSKAAPPPRMAALVRPPGGFAPQPAREATAPPATAATAEAHAARVRELELELAAKQSALDAAGEQLREMENRREEKEREIAALAAQSEVQKVLLQTLSEQRLQLVERIAELDRSVDDSNKRLAGAESRAADLEGKSAATRVELETARAELARAAASLQQGEDALRQIRDQIAREDLRLAAAQSEAETAEVRLAEHQRRIAEREIALTSSLSERVRELEARHDFLRRSLQAGTDENTVMLFANDLIKRIDLIDALIQRVTGPGVNGGMEHQLRTLRASFGDILEAHGITEFKVAPGTEADLNLRQHITIVESIPGSSRPRIVESYRPGFTYSPACGGEVVLRKVEVKTSSE